VDTSDELVEYLLAGTDVVTTDTILLRDGIDHLQALLSAIVMAAEESLNIDLDQSQITRLHLDIQGDGPPTCVRFKLIAGSAAE
jgi:hypothetical protein